MRVKAIHHGLFTVELIRGTSVMNVPGPHGVSFTYRENLTCVRIENGSVYPAEKTIIKFSVHNQKFAWVIKAIKRVLDGKGQVIWPK